MSFNYDEQIFRQKADKKTVNSFSADQNAACIEADDLEK